MEAENCQVDPGNLEPGRQCLDYHKGTKQQSAIELGLGGRGGQEYFVEPSLLILWRVRTRYDHRGSRWVLQPFANPKKRDTSCSLIRMRALKLLDQDPMRDSRLPP